jgi:hypothetical protein
MEQSDALTVQFPREVLARATALKGDDKSLNDLIVEAVNLELQRRQGVRAHEEIVRLAKRVREENGLHLDSVPLIRELRDGEGRAD